MEKKKELRKQMAILKSRLRTSGLLPSLSADILKRLEENPHFVEADTLLLYHSLPDEVDTHDFIRRWSGKKRVILPVVQGDRLILKSYHGPDEMAVGAYGIEEPTGPPFEELESIRCVVVPGVAFDRMGNRLGRGKGYYDRLLPDLPHAYRIGICFPFQIVEQVPAEPTDICMDEIITI